MALDDKAKEALKFVSDTNEKVDAKADSLLDKMKASKWTAAMLLAVAVALVVFLFN